MHSGKILTLFFILNLHLSYFLVFRSMEMEKNTMGSRRVCGEEWITSTGAGSMSRLGAVSMSRVTSSMVRPDSFPTTSATTRAELKQHVQELKES